jgi:hypothetical protein
MANGWQMLGNAMGGGVEASRQSGYEQGMQLGAQTQNALAQARVRRIDEAQKMQEHEARKNMQESLVQAFGLDATTAAGMAGLGQAGMGNAPQLMDARMKGQSHGFREEMAAPGTEFGRAQQLRMAAGDSPFERVGSGGGQLWDRFSDDPMGSSVTTPGTEASIRQRDAAASLSAARESWGPRAPIQIGLGNMFGPGGIGTELPPSTLPEGVDFTQAAGVPGFMRGVGNTLADVVGGRLPFPEAQDAIQALENLSTRTMIMMQESVPGRPSLFLMQRLEELALRPGDFRAGSEIGKRKVNQTLSLLKGELARMERLASVGQETAGNRDALKSGVASTQQLISDYQALADAFNRQGNVQRPTEVPEGWQIRRIE